VICRAKQLVRKEYQISACYSAFVGTAAGKRPAGLGLKVLLEGPVIDLKGGEIDEIVLVASDTAMTMMR
jgi:hypothetical protein